MIELCDKDRIFNFLRLDPNLHLYSIGDLDDFFWPQTTWYGLEKKGALKAVFLIYRGAAIPTLVALEEQDHDSSRKLLSSMIEILPDHFYCNICPTLPSLLTPHFRLESHGTHHKMSLSWNVFEKRLSQALPDQTENANNYTCRPLSNSDLSTIKIFYDTHYPENWFDSRMLETGKYFGLFTNNKLAAAGGVHVYSETYNVAAIGNITTHTELRGQGLSKMIVSTLCQGLRGKVERIGLNVKSDNTPAIRCYEGLGFEFHSAYSECMAWRNF